MNGRIEIKIDGPHKSIKTEIDGVMMPIPRVVDAALSLGGPRELPRLELQLLLFEVIVDGVARLELDDTTRTLLVAHGWTEPAA